MPSPIWWVLGCPALPVLLPVGWRWAGRWGTLLFGVAGKVQLGTEKILLVTAPGAGRFQVEVALGEGSSPQWAVQRIRGALRGVGQAVAIPQEVMRGRGPVAGWPLWLSVLKAGVEWVKPWENQQIAGELTWKRRRYPSSCTQSPIWQFRPISCPASFTPASQPVTLMGEAQAHPLGRALQRWPQTSGEQ